MNSQAKQAQRVYLALTTFFTLGQMVFEVPIGIVADA